MLKIKWVPRAFMRILCIMFAAYTCAASSSETPQSTPFRFLEKLGPYSVGLKVVVQYDRSRSFPLHRATPGGTSPNVGPRPIQTLIWYPSSQGENHRETMTVGDYARLADTEVHFDHHDAKNKWLTKLAATSATSLHAIRNGPPLKGRYPVVIYAPGDSSIAWENADLCEYLASHGYVILASPSMGESTRDMTEDIGGIRAQARDISFLISYAQTLPYADVSKVAVAGWSWGGISNLFAAAQDARITVLIALDGSMRYFPGLVKKAGIQPEKMTQPLLFFTRGDFSLEDWDRVAFKDRDGPNVLNAWTHSDLLIVHMLGMAHPEFSSMYQRMESEQRFAENQVADYGREDADTGYAWVARYTLNFLDAYLRSDSSSLAFIRATPAELNGAPKHFISATFRPSSKRDH